MNMKATENKNRIKPIRRTVLALTCAAMLGGAFAVVPLSASAAEAPNVTAATADAAPVISEGAGVYGSLVLSRWLSQLEPYAAAVSDVDADSYASAIDGGQSLVQASGLAEGTLVSRLTAKFAEDLRTEVSAGRLTEAEADQLKGISSDAVSRVLNGQSPASAVGISSLSPGKSIVQSRITRIVADTALLADAGSAELRAALRNGKNLVDASGLDRSALIDGLYAKLTSDLDSQTSGGAVTAEEAATLKSAGLDDIQRIVDTAGYDGEGVTALQKAYGERLLRVFLGSVVQNAASSSDADYGDIVSALEAGGTLASATHVDAGTLNSQLNAAFAAKAEEAWQSGALSVQALEQLEKQAAGEIDKAVNTAGYGTGFGAASLPANKGIAEESMLQLVNQSAVYTDQSAEAIQSAVAGGQSLVQATGISADELTSMLQSSVEASINKAVSQERLLPQEVAATKSYAAGLVASAVTTGGYVPAVDTTSFVQNQLASAIDRIGDLSDKNADELWWSIATGSTPAEAAGNDLNSLLAGLIGPVNQQLNAYVSAGSLIEKDAAAAKAQFADGVIKLLTGK
ncbi:hypothetical protein WMW72_22440 [Paenibacillus filicis]|uniref:DUF1002 domain-containing protein n=1 Tax=Paenibacillus filicis TaxID=669464 RepID=A0ABU9DP71_9BACL